MSAPPLALRLARWPRRFWPGARGQTPPSAPPPPPPDPFRDVGQILRESREARGWSLRALAERTRISIAVLEALERGWKDRLPEATYLRTMLPLLEQELALPPGRLEPVLPAAHQRNTPAPSAGQSLVAAVFSPFTLHFLTRWQGTVLYAVVILGLLLAVNQQQRRLGALGWLASNPVPQVVVAGAGGEARGARAQGAGVGDAVALPPLGPLHPLSRAAEGVALDLLAQESARSGLDGSLGPLRLSLKGPTRVDLRSPRGGDWRLDDLQGDLTLPVLPPFQLRLSPAPRPGSVAWRGKPLPPAGSGFYTVPAPDR
jgi:transcriptional regulator with XRE-family HTH domain